MSLSLNDSQLLKTQAYIGGEWAPATSSATFDVINPATGDVLASVPDMNAADTKQAIAAAEQAWPEWRAMSARKRSKLLRKWYDLITQHSDDLAQLLTAEQGKPHAEAKGEVLGGAAYVEWFAEEAKRIEGDLLSPQGPGQRELVVKQPVGVVAAITPWNFPSSMITRKVSPALAAGCPVVIKPAEDTPLSALALAELAHRAGIPAGVVNVVTASHGAEVGGELATSATVRKLSFTGSTAVGKLLMSQASDTVKKVSLELGGNAPFLVFEDADLDAAVQAATMMKFINSGQTCICVNRLMVHENVYDAFMEKFTAAVDQLNVGNGAEKGVTTGPLINDKGLEKVEGLVKDALGSGAKAVRGGQRHDLGRTFYEPTVLADVNPDMACFGNEIFGPVAPVYRFSSEEEAVRLANDTPYGLAAYYFTRDPGRMWRVGEALEYGMVACNTARFVHEGMPFGGFKESGIGREGSKYGIDEYLEMKFLCMGGL
ncbi:NAD-dependent succinate-semialdehyde dehydrogenase [Aquisalimonas asiatica]|uniref:Succinate-semialdehyde dehydrogenase / glutarate-semialdehyde dehydrogenase n=1 Tax=Aquisalimonas asiatica TaxID=406100 RepID=A0A1H8VV31_9GAMM|nr:NAD-dependent succinate-semialdehyde dehydrogenase [Aquisalimonas asiatica]SEP19170.1 succinate-semialdehyde dehydrogenase / glutarate-semialdehyde dehydrogenase [Aquisalimonas asiatica]